MFFMLKYSGFIFNEYMNFENVSLIFLYTDRFYPHIQKLLGLQNF